MYQRGGVIIMKMYKEIEGNASNIYNVSDTPDTIISREKNLIHPAQITGMIIDGNQLVNPRAIKTTSENAEKGLRTKHKTRLIINLGKTARVAIK